MHYRFWFWSSSHSNRKSYLKLQLHLDLCANPLTKVSKEEDMNWNRILIVTHFIASLKSDWTIQPFPLISLSKQWANSSYELSVHTIEIAIGKKTVMFELFDEETKTIVFDRVNTHACTQFISKQASATYKSIHFSFSFSNVAKWSTKQCFRVAFFGLALLSFFLFFWIDQKKMQ